MTAFLFNVVKSLSNNVRNILTSWRRQSCKVVVLPRWKQTLYRRRDDIVLQNCKVVVLPRWKQCYIDVVTSCFYVAKFLFYHVENRRIIEVMTTVRFNVANCCMFRHKERYIYVMTTLCLNIEKRLFNNIRRMLYWYYDNVLVQHCKVVVLLRQKER